MKDKIIYVLVCLFMLLGGIGGIYYGVHRFIGGPDQVVDCGGQVMHPGDTCRETRNGSPTGAKSYSEQKDAQNSIWGPITVLVVGSVLAIVGGGGLWLQVSSRSKGAAIHPSSAPVLAAAPPSPGATPQVPAAKFGLPTLLPFSGLVRPSGVAVDAAGSVYVTDNGTDRVVMLAAGSSSATLLPFSGLVGPSGVAVDAAGNVYVSEFGGERVMVLVAGTSTPKVLGPFTGLCGPTGVAVDRAGNLYVGDLGSGFGKGRVLMLAAGSSSAKGLPFGGLEYPGGVAVDSTGNVYAVDGAGAGNPRVVKLAATQRAGAFGARP